MAPSIKSLGLSLATLVLLGSASPAFAQPTTTDAPLPAPPHTPQAPYILHVSDVHLNTSSTTTTYGQDTGLDLWRSLKAKLQTLIDSKTPPAFIIFTGDLPAHYACGPVNCYLPPGQRASHNTNMAVLLEDLRSLVSRKNIPLFFIPGNNDGLAGDYFSFADARQKTALNLVPEARNPYPALNTAPRCGAPPCLVADPHPKMGYYAARPIPGLRLIGLNTIIWGSTYWPVDGLSQREAGNTQMLWFAEQLRQAAEQGEKVHVLMHIPPGVDAYAAAHGSATPLMWAALPAPGMTWQDQFLGLVNHYSATVTGLFYGHTHMDELRLLYDRTGTKVREVAISSPGVTPLDSNNPGFKRVFFDPATKEVIDFITSYSTPTASRWGDASYLFSTVYGCTPQPLVQCLAKQPLEQINSKMQTIFLVKNGLPSYPTAPGIPVTFSP
ncbi:MAG: metallophosphoesterase [Cyanobacteriota bacterium]|nr:metallophosphoesterase [Cyanobacteriota bacterium]